MTNAFDVITEYCLKNGKSFAVRNHAYCVYVQALDEAITRTGATTPRTIDNTSAALLSESAIESYVTNAERFSDQLTMEAVAKLVNDRRFKDFFYSVGSSVVGSLLFTILLVAMFWIGRDQIRSWLVALQPAQLVQ